jgi:hypothetical protein
MHNSWWLFKSSIGCCPQARRPKRDVIDLVDAPLNLWPIHRRDVRTLLLVGVEHRLRHFEITEIDRRHQKHDVNFALLVKAIVEQELLAGSDAVALDGMLGGHCHLQQICGGAALDKDRVPDSLFECGGR